MTCRSTCFRMSEFQILKCVLLTKSQRQLEAIYKWSNSHDRHDPDNQANDGKVLMEKMNTDD